MHYRSMSINTVVLSWKKYHIHLYYVMNKKDLQKIRNTILQIYCRIWTSNSSLSATGCQDLGEILLKLGLNTSKSINLPQEREETRIALHRNVISKCILDTTNNKQSIYQNKTKITHVPQKFKVPIISNKTK